MNALRRNLIVTGMAVGLLAGSVPAHAEVDLRSLLKDGLLGAGVGALSAGVGKGNAGTGALVGAGTNIIGGSLLSFLTSPSSGGGQAVYATRRQVYAAEPVYYTQPVYSQPTYTTQPVYAQPVSYSQPTYTYQPAAYTQSGSQDASAKKIIKDGLLGAGVGALSAGVGKGNAGTGALVGAGTNVIGGALLDFLVAPSASSGSQTAYYTTPGTNISPKNSSNTSSQLHKRIVRTYDGQGNLVREEEFWE